MRASSATTPSNGPSKTLATPFTILSYSSSLHNPSPLILVTQTSMNFVVVEVHIYFTLRTTVFKLGVQPSYSFSLFLFCMENTAPELVAALQENYKKVASGLLDKAKNICSNYGIVARTVTEIGDPKKAICEAVEKFNIELLVLGSHGRGIVQRAFLGSVSNYCIHNARCTVLVVRKPM
ncbi:PREDICTED: universal stress protein Sll1388-like isoform 1 [Fragaria vesca subsp. vesca]